MLNKRITRAEVSDLLALRGIPLDVGIYRLRNRSTLECGLDQSRTTDHRSGITNNPNREDDPTLPQKVPRGRSWQGRL